MAPRARLIVVILATFGVHTFEIVLCTAAIPVRLHGPALANECVQTNAAGQVVLKLKTPWRDGPAGRARPVAWLNTAHLAMSPLERPSCARWWCRKGPRRPRSPHNPPGARPAVHPTAGAAELRQAAQTRVGDRPEARPELRARDHRCLPGTAGEKILTHLGLQTRAPLRAPARGSQLQPASPS